LPRQRPVVRDDFVAGIDGAQVRRRVAGPEPVRQRRRVPAEGVAHARHHQHPGAVQPDRRKLRQHRYGPQQHRPADGVRMKRHDGGGKIRAIRMAEEGEARGIGILAVMVSAPCRLA